MAGPGHHRRILMARTEPDAQENQARRLLADFAAYRGTWNASAWARSPRL